MTSYFLSFLIEKQHFGGSRFVTERNGAYFFVCIGVFCGLSIFVLRVARLCTNVNDPMLMIARFSFTLKMSFSFWFPFQFDIFINSQFHPPSQQQQQKNSFVFLVIGFSLMIRPGTTASQFIAGVVVSVVGYSLGISSSVSVLFMILPPAARVRFVSEFFFLLKVFFSFSVLPIFLTSFFIFQTNFTHLFSTHTGLYVKLDFHWSSRFESVDPTSCYFFVLPCWS